MKFFITGGSRGVGADLVKVAALAGHDVAFTYSQRADKANEVVASLRGVAGAGKVLAYALDVKNPEAVERVGDQVLTDFDTVDVVVNSAAVNKIGMAFSMSNEDWREVIDANLNGAFWVTRQFLPTFLSQGRGRFIHLSSVAAGGSSGHIAYCASKAGLHGLSKALGKEYGRKGITSNVLILGTFDTDMTREQMSPQLKDFWLQHCPVGRFGQLSEVAAAVLYLASDGAGFVNCQELSITGGLDWTA